MKHKILILRFFLAFGVGLIVFVTSVLAVWRMMPATMMANDILFLWTRDSLRLADEALKERIAKGKLPPPTLKELTSELPDSISVGYEIPKVKRGVVVDGWGRPFLYSTHGTTCTLRSYGRDGKPGGTGLDMDIDLTNCDRSLKSLGSDTWRNPPMPTLKQYLLELPTGGMTWGCVLCGLTAFGTGFFFIRPVPMTQRQIFVLAVKLVITIAATVFFATIIMQGHIPSGH